MPHIEYQKRFEDLNKSKCKCVVADGDCFEGNNMDFNRYQGGVTTE